jgi:DNA-binding CsgD family transcriptional regulator
MIMNPLPATYLEFLTTASNYREDVTLRNGENEFKKIFDDFEINDKLFPIAYVVDLTQKNYLLVHDRCKHVTGYSSNYFLKGGLDAYISKWRKFDFELYNEKIFPQNLEVLSKSKPEEITHLVFSHSYNFKRPDGNEAKIMERVSFIISPDTLVPVGAVGSVIDITHFKNNDSIVHTIESVNKIHKNEVRTLLYKKTYFNDECLAQLSEREMEVLKWMVEGLASKQIADKMRISVNTISNHRRNMLQKTNCLNTIELIAHIAKSNIM